MQKSSHKFFSPQKNYWPVILFLAILGFGLAVRLVEFREAPLDFHPARQMHSAILARGYYAEWGAQIYTNWERSRAIMLEKTEAIIEPPILEGLTAFFYLLTGGENLWIARLFSIFFWLVGGVFLFRLIYPANKTAGACAALAYFLLLPYGVLASRSFQPDPLMVALIISALAVFYKNLAASSQSGFSLRQAVLPGLLAGLAILVKQVAAFYILGGFAGLILASLGLKKALRSPGIWLAAGLSLLPVAAYNIYGLWIKNFLQGQYTMRFFPMLYTDPGFYLRWLGKMDSVVGLWVLVLAACGLALQRDRLLKALQTGFLAGYLAYGFALPHHISTHDYYQLPLIIFVALGLAPLAEAVFAQIKTYSLKRLSVLWICAALLLGSFYTFYQVRNALRKVDYNQQAEDWRKMGQLVGVQKTATTIGLFEDYGAALTYYGYVVPAQWPTTGDVEFLDLAGRTPETRFDQLSAGKDYFIVTNFKELENQPELKEQLALYKTAAQGTGYVIYDLRNLK